MDTPYSDSYNAPSDPSPSLGADHELQRVREILFGEMARSLHDRLDALDGRLTSEVGSLRAAISEETERLREAMDAGRSQDRDERDEQQRGLAEAISQTRAEFDARTDALERALRENVDEQTAILSRQLTQTETTLRDAKTDRSLLADLLGRVAEGLRDAEPGAEPDEPVIATLAVAQPERDGGADESAFGEPFDSPEAW